jgi:uncharacterized membrane protein
VPLDAPERWVLAAIREVHDGVGLLRYDRRVHQRVLRAASAEVGLYAASVAALGALLLAAKFAYVWARIPEWVPGRDVLASIVGAVMLLLAAGLLWRRTVVPSAAALTFLFLGWLVFLQVPRIAHSPSKEFLWAGGAQIVTVVAGASILFASLASPTGAPQLLRGERGVQLARSLYAVALPLLGIHHFADLAGTAEAVPAWLPFRFALGALTGAAHVAAGIAILFRIVPRLAATLEAIMILAFVLLVHAPGVIGEPGDRLQWSMLVIASLIGAAAWIVARSYGSEASSS